MKFDIVDLTDLGAQRAHEELISAARDGAGDAVFLMGHGSFDGQAIEDLSEQHLDVHDGWRFMWLHACLCGRHLIEGIAKTGRSAVGFVINVLVTPQDDGKAELFTAVEEQLGELEPETPCWEILSEVRDRWFALAEEAWEEENLLRVAIINQHRLSIRCCSSTA